ncbi:uncharacterized protein LOC123517089 [Portunus trituberculatus]|uniref:uncharacterized protein LOC123517089 n=1 Tax=Portunus trituberculatus TaxID=210409 RepID=UPI001E1CB7A8|nr:uncharacterized protein LOC123517089 [Portunus trituberculatus]
MDHGSLCLLPLGVKSSLAYTTPTGEVPIRPFEDVSADLFTHADKDYLIYADRLSGWSCIAEYGREASSRTTTKLLCRIFRVVGVPVRLRSNGGPQFTSSTFRSFIQRWGINHVMSSPGYPQSNEHADAFVKKVKYLIAKVCATDAIDEEAFDRGLLELRKTPRPDSRSSAQVLDGHPLRSAVPAHRRAFAPEWQVAGDEYDARWAATRRESEKYYNKNARSLPPLHIGDYVRLQDRATKRWNKIGVVVGVGGHRHYHVKLPTRIVLSRNKPGEGDVTVNSEPVKADVGTSANTPGQTHASSSTQSHLQSPAAVSYNPAMSQASPGAGHLQLANSQFISLGSAHRELMYRQKDAFQPKTHVSIEQVVDSH